MTTGCSHGGRCAGCSRASGSSRRCCNCNPPGGSRGRSRRASARCRQGGLNTVLVDPVLTQISNATANIEIPLNIALIVVFLALGIGLAVVKREQLRPFLIASIVMSVRVLVLLRSVRHDPDRHGDRFQFGSTGRGHGAGGLAEGAVPADIGAGTGGARTARDRRSGSNATSVV